jgi:hypothetical protein
MQTILKMSEIPSLISSMNCSQVSALDIKTYMAPIQSNSSVLGCRFAVPVPDQCGAPCINNTYVDTCDGKSYFYDIDTSNKLPQNVGNQTFGRVVRIPTNTSSASPSRGCPQFAILYGINSVDGQTLNDMVAMNCYPVTNHVNVDVTFQLPDWTVLSLNRSTSLGMKDINDSVDAIVDPNVILPASQSCAEC